MKHIKTQKLSDRYEDLGLLGRGGMGEVRRVFDQVLGRAVAMKLIHLEHCSDEFLARFVEEAQLSARLQHPNLLPIHDLGHLPNGQLYFTMKIAEGESLSKRIKQLHQTRSKNTFATEGQPYSLRRLLSAFKQVCDAVAYAHQRGVIHRDIKPDNIVIGDHGTVQLLDWGIAKRLESYFTEWVNEVVNHFKLEVTPVSKLIDPARQSQSDLLDEDLLDEDLLSMQLTISESLNQDTNQAAKVSKDSDEDDRFAETIMHSNLTDNEEVDQTPIHVISNGVSDQMQYTISEHTQLSRFSVSSEELISMNASVLTQRSSHGVLAGTLEYMAPEQLKGQVQQISYASDVFGLGVVLYEILVGQSPFKLPKNLKEQGLNQKLKASLQLRESKLTWPSDSSFIAEELKQICEAALHPEIAQRTQSVSELAESLVRYLDGVGRREKGLEKVKEAEIALAKAERLKKVASELFFAGNELCKKQKSSDPLTSKKEGWTKLDEADAYTEQAIQLEFSAERALHDALLYDHALSEAHSLLAERAQQVHKQSELITNTTEARRQEGLIKSHLNYVTPTLASRLQRYLSNTALVQLKFAVPQHSNIEIQAQAYLLKDRHLVLGDIEVWSQAPCLTKEVPLGSYLLTIKAEGYKDLHYPIFVEREQGWHGLDPNGDDLEIPLLSQETQVPHTFKYVPQGWFYTGGDPLVSNNVEEKRRLWLDGFFMAESHVTHREYLEFLKDLCSTGQRDLAYHLRPRLRDEEGEGLYHFSGDSIEIIENEFVKLDWPANYTNYESALRYSEWFGQKLGIEVRLPMDMEWEKVARNVDARSFPWGEYFDPSFVHMRLSMEQAHPGLPQEWPIDCSPWGHFGLSGSMRDWTSTLFKTPFPYLEGQRVKLASTEEQKNLVDERVVRGGSWKTQEGNCRSAFRFVATPSYRDDDGSFRLAFSWDDALSLSKRN